MDSKPSSRKRQLLSCAVAAATVTALVHLWNLSLVTHKLEDESLRWARQVTTQAEALALKAREAGEGDPVAWAVTYLAQGIEPRVIQISRLDIGERDLNNPERYALNRAEGTFEFDKPFFIEHGVGVRVVLNVGFRGFFGTRSPLAADLLTAAFFAFFTALFWFFSRPQLIRKLVLLWIGAAKSSLTQHGVHIREMVRQSRILALAAYRSREIIGPMREGASDALSGLRKQVRVQAEIEAIAASTEKLATALARQLAAPDSGGTDAQRVARLAAEVQQGVALLTQAVRKAGAVASALEKRIEPLTGSLEQAYGALDGVKEIAQTLNRHIGGTTETLMEQAKLIQQLHLDVERGEAAAIAGEGPVLDLSSSTPSAAAIAAPGVAKLPEPLPALKNR